MCIRDRKDQLQGSAEVAELIKIGVDSIKVEGRMKSPNYVYAAVRYYRELIDKATGVSSETAAKRLSIKSSGAPESEADEESRRLDIAGLFNRGYDRGYYYEHDPKIVNEFFASNLDVYKRQLLTRAALVERSTWRSPDARLRCV